MKLPESLNYETRTTSEKVDLIQDSNFDPKMFKMCIDYSYSCGYKAGQHESFEKLRQKLIDDSFDVSVQGAINALMQRLLDEE